jgi:hypothetical protein
MKLATESHPFTLLTPAMIGGAEGKLAAAEMRVSSIRGQVRWWHRKAGLIPSFNEVWGQTDGAVIASKVSLVLEPSTPVAHLGASILPHDLSKSGPPRDAVAPGQSFTLTLRRLVGCRDAHWTAARKAVKLWLLLGGLGLRVNRAAGSVWPLGDWVPKDEETFKALVLELGYTQPVQFAAAALASTQQDLRRHASDTVKGSPHLFGEIKPRIPSPLKMKVICLGQEHRLLLTGLDSNNMAAARNALANKALGKVPWI